MADLGEQILALLGRKNYVPLKAKALARKLGVSTPQYPELRRALRQLLRDGRIATLPLGSAGMPSDLGAPADEIRRVVVYLSNAGLKRMNLIDTPGLNTVTRLTRWKVATSSAKPIFCR